LDYINITDISKAKVTLTSLCRATEHHLPYGITQCYLPLDTGKPSSQADWYLNDLPQWDRRPSWPEWLIINLDVFFCPKTVSHPSK